ncbi:MAG: zinc ribbon domain-containing protein [Gemmatimonadaceae bacterium]|jgi:predicted  nucleic acid-binding Zn-ribbon protein
MQQEVESLLALQQDDLKIREIENQIRSLDPQLAEFDRKKENAAAALTRAETAVQAEEKKQRELQSRLSQHKTMQERNLHQLEDVKRLREATAATAQVEATRRLMAEDESEIAILGRRINEMNAAVSASKQAIATLEEEQRAARPEIEAKRAELQSQLDEAKRHREGKAVSIARPMLGKYDRIRGKRAQALYPLRGGSCGNCDTAVPLQRRNMMTASGQIEICEACGVLLYAEG